MESKLKFSKDRKILSKLPESPGVYIFWQGTKVIYIGKAVNLKSRVSSYLTAGLAPKTQAMVNEANFLSFVRVDSELDSLLLEASLIKKFQPRYNFAAKDDKHPLYIRITKDEFPKVITARKIEEDEKNIAFYGPFASSTSVRSVLKMLRRIFPYGDHKPYKKPCIYSHIGLCNPCPSQIQNEPDIKNRLRLMKQYLKNIHMIRMVLERKTPRVEKMLLKNMQNLAEEENFEEAKIVRDKLMQLTYITQKPIPSFEFLKNPNLVYDLRAAELSALKKILTSYMSLNSLSRIECYDIAHLAGTSPTASMVCFIDGEAEKYFYRRFSIRQERSRSDVHSLEEVAERRIKHLKDWGRPDLIIVDGGKAQVGVFRKYFEILGIPVIGIAKRYETLIVASSKYGVNSFKEFRIPKGPAFSLITRIRDEAHRFARKYHHLLVQKALES